MADIIQFRRGTAAQATAANAVLADGEPGWEKDTNKIKIGDGVTPWNSLPYFGGGGGSTLTMGDIESSPNAQGATITAGVLSLAAADESNGGVVTAAAQVFGGSKTFNAESFWKAGKTSNMGRFSSLNYNSDDYGAIGFGNSVNGNWIYIGPNAAPSMARNVFLPPVDGTFTYGVAINGTTYYPNGSTGVVNLGSVGGGGGGSVTSFAFTNGGGFTGTVTNANTTPTLALTYSESDPTVNSIIKNIPVSADATINKYLQWNGSAYARKQVDYGEVANTPSLSGYEVTSNKATGFGTLNNTLYPTTQAVANYVTGLGYQTGNQSITLSGEASGSGATAISVTLANSAVIGKVLTGFSTATSTAVVATDTILAGMGKLQGQINGLSGSSGANALGTYIVQTATNAPSNAQVLGSLATGYLRVTTSTGVLTSTTTVAGGDVSGNISGNAANVTGTVAVGNGGTGATTLTGVVFGNGTAAMTALAATAGSQYLRRNSGNAAYEFGTIAKADVGLGNVENTALSTWTGSANITTLGTIGTGTWQGTVVGSTYGGTGVNNAGRTLTINTNSGTIAFSAASTTLTVAGTSSVNGTNTGDQNVFANVAVSGQTTVASASTTGTLTLVAGTNVTITTDNTAKSVTINAASTGMSNPMTAVGDVIYGGTAGAPTRLAGAAGFLKSTGAAAPTWSSVTKSDVGLANVENTALSTWAGSANITTVGTVGTGTWQGTVVGSTYGGTGVNNAGRTLTISTNSGTLLFSAASTTLTIAGTSSVNGTNTGDQNVFANVAVSGQTTVASASTTGTLTLVAGTNITITTDNTAKSVTINSTAGGMTNPMNTTGDIIYGGAAGAPTRLAGAAGFLKSTGSSAPTWSSVTKSDVGLGNVENTALSTWTGSTNITTLGTVATGTWQGTAIGATYVGNLPASKITSGQIAAAQLAAGTATEGYGISVVSGVPTWQDANIYMLETVFTGTGTLADKVTIINGGVTNAMLAGSIGVDKINATGTRDATTVLHGNGTWAVPSGSGGASTSASNNWTASQIFSAGFQTHSTGNSSNLRLAGNGVPTNTGSGLHQIGGASNTDFRAIIAGDGTGVITAGSSFGALIFSNQTITEGASGTHPLIAQVAIRPLVIQDGVATTTNAATLYVEGAATGTATPTNNRSVWIAGGISRFDGLVELNAGAKYTTAPSTYSVGNYDVLVRNQTTGNVELTTITSGGVSNGDKGDVNVVGSTDWRVESIAGGLIYLGAVTPTQFTANQNDFSVASNILRLRISADAPRTITGIAGGTDGRVLLVTNVGAQPITFASESASSVAANRFSLTRDIVLFPNEGVYLHYGTVANRWRMDTKQSFDGAAITTGTIAPARLGAIGTPSSTTVLYGNGEWKTPTGSGDALLAGGTTATPQTWTGANLMQAPAGVVPLTLKANAAEGGYVNLLMGYDKWNGHTITLRSDGFIGGTQIATNDNTTAAIAQGDGYMMNNSSMIKWSADGTWWTGTKWAGIAAAADGMVQINNGTLGTLRDLTVRGYFSRIDGMVDWGPSGTSDITANSGLTLSNLTAATAVTQNRNPPGVRFVSQWWDSGATVSRQTETVLRIQESAAGSNTIFAISQRRGTGNWSDMLVLNSYGQFEKTIGYGIYGHTSVSESTIATHFTNGKPSTGTADNQLSPMHRYYASGWKTAATAGAQWMTFQHGMLTETGVNNPVGVYQFHFGTNSQAATLTNDILRLEWGGRNGMVVNNVNTAGFVSTFKGKIATAGTAPTVAATGIGASGTVALETGSTDLAGVITLSVAGGSPGSTGTVTLTFNNAYTGNMPSIILTLINGSGAWGALATVKQTTQSLTAPVFTWANSATGAAVALAAGSTYKIAYQIIAK